MARQWPAWRGCRHLPNDLVLGRALPHPAQSSLSGRFQALAHRVRIRPTDGPPNQATVLLALPVPRFQVHARVMLLDVDVFARVPALLQLLPRLGK